MFQLQYHRTGNPKVESNSIAQLVHDYDNLSEATIFFRWKPTVRSQEQGQFIMNLSPGGKIHLGSLPVPEGQPYSNAVNKHIYLQVSPNESPEE